MAFLGALGSIAGGLGAGIQEGEELQTQRLQRQARDALGKTFAQPDQGGQANPAGTGLSGLGGLNQQGPQPQPMSPGQPSQPMQQPGNQNSQQPVQSAPLPPPQATPQMAAATAGQESGGNYKAVGNPTASGDRAYGKYQVLGANIPQWTKDVLGQSMTPQQFLLNPQAQDAVYKTKFGQLAQKYGPEGAAKAWFAGEGGMNNPNAKDVNGMSVQRYGQNFADSMGPGGQPAGGAGQPPGGQPQQQGPGHTGIQQLAARISKANPGIKPGVLWQAMAQAMPMMNADEKQAFAEQSTLFKQQLEGQNQQIKILQDQIGNTLKQANLGERQQHDQAMEGATAARTDAQVKETQARVKIATDNAEAARKKAVASQGAADFRQKMAVYNAALKDKTAAEQNLRALQSGGKPDQMSGDDYTKELQGAQGEADAARKKLAGTKEPSADDAPSGPRNEDAPGKGAAAAQGQQPVPDDIKQKALDAIKRGAPRAAVLQRLQTAGYDVSGL